MLGFPPQKRAPPMPTNRLHSIDSGIVTAQAARAGSQPQRRFRHNNLNPGMER